MLTPFKLTRLAASNVKMGYDEKKKKWQKDTTQQNFLIISKVKYNKEQKQNNNTFGST